MPPTAHCGAWSSAASRSSRKHHAASRGLKASHPDIPWQKVASIGNVLRHDYDAVNDATIWHAATVDILPLKAALVALLHELDADVRR